jgi:hypothetical protein
MTRKQSNKWYKKYLAGRKSERTQQRRQRDSAIAEAAGGDMQQAVEADTVAALGAQPLETADARLPLRLRLQLLHPSLQGPR